VNSFVCNHIAVDALLPSLRLTMIGFRRSQFRPLFARALTGAFSAELTGALRFARAPARPFALRPMTIRWVALAVTLMVSFFFSAEGADARLKSEWKFGGSFARLISLPFFDNVINDDAVDVGSVAPVVNMTDAMLPQAAQPTGGSLGGLFNRPGVVGGFSAGFLGAGVLGIVFGHGMTSELTGAASFLGLIFQITVILMGARLFWTWWRADRSAALADMSPRQLADAYGRLRNEALPDIEDAGAPDLAEVNDGALRTKDR
jgi:hypothetical protein